MSLGSAGISGENDGSRSPTLARAATLFVGRRQELEWLEQWFQEAVEGHPRVVLIQGEAGIGKTRLLQEARSIARRLGVHFCLGRCFEDLTLPYLPFVDSLLPLFDQAPDEVKLGLGSDLEVIDAFVRGTSTPRAAVQPAVTAHTEQEKLQLFLAMGRATVKVAQSHATIFVVDDLHWADRLSLDLFDHLVFTVADTAYQDRVPLLVIGTYRPVEAEERLARLCARLQREGICRSFTLSGLNELEVQELIGGLGLARPSHQLTTTVSEATQGNPLFIQEVLHDLVRQQALQERGGYLVTDVAASDLGLPDQVTGAIVSRIQGLSEACRRALTFASFLGDRASLEVLGAVSVGEDELLNLLEEGMRQRMLRREEQVIQFAHPLIRHAFYHEPSAARRQRLHQQIAQNLRRLYAGREDKRLLEIAHHLVRAGPAAPADIVVDYARRAADQAFRVFAWSDAARYYEAALSAAESSGHLSPSARADLHYQAGLAHYHDQDVGPCLHHYERAIRAYQLSGDVRGLAQALIEQTRTRLTLAAVPLGTVADIRPLEDVLAALGDEEPALRGRIAAIVAEAYRHGRQAKQARERAQQALAIGQQLKDDVLCANASFALALAQINGLNVREALSGWQSTVTYARRGSDFIREGWALHRIPLAFTLLGQLEEAEAAALQACAVTRKSYDWGNHSLGLSHLASMAVAKGDFKAAERFAHEAMLMVSRSRYPWGGLRALLALACARTLPGAWAEAEDALDLLVAPEHVFVDAGPIVRTFARVFRQLVRAHASTPDEALFPLAADLMKNAGTDTYSLAPLCAVIELADRAAAPAIAEHPYQALLAAAARGITFSTGWMFLIPRVLGSAAALNRRWDAAGTHFQTALEVATKVHAQPELGRTYLDYARMLTSRRRRADRRQAIELMLQATDVLREVGMQPFARQAEELSAALEVRMTAPPPPRGDYPDGLNSREVEVLGRLAQGRTAREIAAELVLGTETVAGHLSNVFRKIGVSDEAAAIRYAAEKGLVSAVGRKSQTVAERERVVPEAGDLPLRIILVSDIVESAALIRRAGDVKAYRLLEIHNWS
ncbi:MAG: AAA family ATPase [Candidatus Rokuibacteriota bacterium]